MELSLAKCLETIARQDEQLVTQAATLERLFKAQADPEEIQTSTYEVADSVLQKLGRNSAGKCLSWTSSHCPNPNDAGFSGNTGVRSARFPLTLTC